MQRLVAIVIVLLISLSLIAAHCAVVTTVPPAESQAASAAEGVAAPAGPVIKVMEPFARASMPNGAVYMHLTNEGDADDRLTSAATDVAETVELHETKMDENDVMKMSPIDAVELPAGGLATLEPGGMHVMLLGLKKELATGDIFELTLNFEQSSPQTIEVEVTEGMAVSHGQMAPEQADDEMEAMDHSQEAEADMTHADEAGETAEHSHDAEDQAASSAAMQPQVFKVVVAAYLLDTAGFHAMDDRLNEAGQIEANDAGVVTRVNRLLAVTDWPDELKPQAEALQTILARYAEALSNDEVEAAKPLATQAHEAQHDLSHTIGSWLGKIEGDSGSEQIFQIATAAYLMDTVGFHAMDDRLNGAGQIEANDGGVVNRINRLLAVTDWPDELNPPAEELQIILAAYAEALSNDDVEAAKPLATQAHEAQHNLSHDIEHWLADHLTPGEYEIAATEADRRFQVTIAAYLMDTAGFHAMDDRLNEAGQIEAGDAGVVNRVNRLLVVTDWPDELNAPAEALQTILADYAEALSNDEIEAAKPLAAQAHEAQHDLSHTIGSWLSDDHGPGVEHQPGETGSHEDDAGHGD